MTNNRHLTKRFIEENFEATPLHMIKRAYEFYEDIQPLTDETWGYPMWGTLFRANTRFLEQFILDHLQEIQEIGFFVYETEEGDILLGIDGAGYDFIEAHWQPLYELYRG